MKKLLFVPSLVLIGVLAGCKTALLDPSGNPVKDASGNVVMVSSSTKEKTEKAMPAARMEIRSTIDAAAKGGSPAEIASYKMPESRIKLLLGDDASQEEIDAMKAVAESEAQKYRTEVVYPAYVEQMKKKLDAEVAKFLADTKYQQASDLLASVKKTGVTEIDDKVRTHADNLNKSKVATAWAASIVDKLRPAVKACVAKGKYEQARELLWRAPTTGYSEVDALIREFTIETMHVEVNPAEWSVIEAELKAKAAEFEKAKKFDEAMAWFKAYRRVRTYSVKLDEKLKTVEAELVKIGVKGNDMKPILDATGAMVKKAEKIIDMVDVTTNSVTTVKGKEIAGVSPDLEEYQEKLEEYRKTLVRYNCTEPASTNIVVKFNTHVEPLLRPFYRPATTEKGSTSKKAFLQLGTGGLNARIDKATAAYIKQFKDKKAAHLAALRAAAIKAATEKMIAEMTKCVEEGEYEKAREVFWKATSTKDIDMNNHLRKAGVVVMLTLVNPSNWEAIEKEFAAKVKGAKEDASYDDAIAWAEAYPAIRTYTAAIDARLDDVKESLVKLGVAEDKIQSIVEETKKATVEMERLASHVDSVKVDKAVAAAAAVKPTLPVECTKLLADYRTALVRNDCTEANADKLVARFIVKAAPLIDVLSGTEGKKAGVLLLGSNAVNDRLAKLRAKVVNELKSLKYEHVFKELIAKTTEAVAQGKFNEARNVVRDVPLVKDAEWDAKIYATRIGLLNSVVNPNQCKALLDDIDAKVKEFFDAKDYEGFREYAEKYEYVHDTYQQIEAALDQLKAAMAGLKIADETAADYIDKLSARIRDMMEKREGKYVVKVDADLTELEKALAELEKGIVAQYYKPAEIAQFRQLVKKEILSLITKAPDPMTTWELNEALRARLAKYLAQLDGLIAKRDAENAAAAYAKLLADIDADVSLDSQIAMAEDAIAKQLGIKCPMACLKVNALLGEYARVMRLMKLGQKVTPAQATTMLLGGAYLDQSGVIEKAIKLGADVNGVSDRDPLRRTALLLAIQTGHNSLLKQLADAKAALAVADADGDTALHYAVRRGNLAVVKAMLAKNDVNKVNKAGETALFIAVRRNQEPLVSALIKAGANVTLKNAKGQTAMDVACLAGSRDVLDALADAKAEFGPAQLAIAADKDRLAVAQWLIGKGVDVNAPGVMEASRRGTPTQCYLVHEGGVLKDCGKDKGCEGGEAAGDGKSQAKPMEGTGTINFTLKEAK